MYQIIFYMIAGSFTGYLLEMFWYRMLRGRWICRKGVVAGPLSPLYGVAFAGFVVLQWLLRLETAWKKFMWGAILGSAFEYAASVLQEKVLGTKSWDYSRHRFNLNGRISLTFMLMWGCVAVFVLEYIKPVCDRIFYSYFSEQGMRYLLLAAGVLFLTDCLISGLACLRQRGRRSGKDAKNQIDSWLDSHYPDEKLEEIFTEIRWVQ